MIRVSAPPHSILLGELPGLAPLQLSRWLAAAPDVQVVGTAATSEELTRLWHRLRPTLVIAGETALSTLRHLNAARRVPVLLYANATPLPGTLREAALLGVFDYMLPVLPREHSGLPQQRTEFWRKIRQVLPSPAMAATRTAPASLLAPLHGLVVLGGSTGGAKAVEQVVQALSPTFRQAMVVAVHMPAQFTRSFVERLRRLSPLPVQVATPEARLQAGTILVVPGGQNMLVNATRQGPWQGWQLDVAPGAAMGSDVPSVDVLLSSAARALGRRVTGVILSGLGNDGTQGAQQVRAVGGTMLVQNEQTADMFSMPKSVIQAGLASQVLPLHSIAEFINRAGALPVRAGVASSTQFQHG